MYLLGFDIGSSSIKACLLEAETGRLVANAMSPDDEMTMIVKKMGWAEQEPSVWWKHVVEVSRKIKEKAGSKMNDVGAIGISYQMHGLVVVDRDLNVLRPSIIWCDSRAVGMGEKMAGKIGSDDCLKHLLNLPGNFTASKLLWVRENEPDVYGKVWKAMLPGDFIAMKMTGEVKTTGTGLSEGILWDFTRDALADQVLDAGGMSRGLIPDLVPVFSVHGRLSQKAAGELGLKAGIPISYRAGDQPNNALSLNCINPGDVAATAGTSGVVYAVSDKISYDPLSRVNTFLHVNHSKENHRYGTLLCINGTGILYSWLKHTLVPGMDYKEMDGAAGQSKPGAEGLFFFPYGNGAERTLENIDIGSMVARLNFNIHKREHVLRAAQEGVIFALKYGLDIIEGMGISINQVKAGYANMFKSSLFGEIFANVSGSMVELYNTDGSQGAARGAGIGAGIYKSAEEAFSGLTKVHTIEPQKEAASSYKGIYAEWKSILETILHSEKEKGVNK
ncbi:MAG: carbohydrate kinase [Spirochaetales bacterium]|nr:carbohydrate kinase [Spirochaetales bacterium]